MCFPGYQRICILCTLSWTVVKRLHWCYKYDIAPSLDGILSISPLHVMFSDFCAVSAQSKWVSLETNKSDWERRKWYEVKKYQIELLLFFWCFSSFGSNIHDPALSQWAGTNKRRYHKPTNYCCANSSSVLFGQSWTSLLLQESCFCNISDSSLSELSASTGTSWNQIGLVLCV